MVILVCKRRVFQGCFGVVLKGWNKNPRLGVFFETNPKKNDFSMRF